MLNKLSKEELELLSYAKIAEMYLKENKKTMSTADLFREVCRLLGLDDNEYQERIADFFESLTTSKDFILLSDGNWDLRANHSVKIDMNDIYGDSDAEADVEEEDNDNNDLSEEDNYEDDYNENAEADIIDDDYSDLTIVDEDELGDEN
ncbi:MAG: DNA-directed RNA polymerase subunit delta [Bacilli bacterium]|nr:DNA-directed RNA polymerase subunit delta [Bacilli bacterium]